MPDIAVTSYNETKGGMTVNKVFSPTIEKLRRSLELGNIEAGVHGFWKHIGGVGSPLIEPHPEDDALSLVTFVWQSNTQGLEVVVYGEFPGFDRVSNLLEQLEGTDIYYKTFVAPLDIWSLYVFRLPGNHGTDSARHVVDPLNPVIYTSPLDDDGSCPLLAPVESVLVLPGVVGEPWKPLAAGGGALCKHRFASRILKNERRIWVYTPPGYQDNQVYPLLLLTDGWEYLHMAQITQRLDRAIELLGPMVVVMVESLGYKQREIELTCYRPFGEFIVDELLPWIHNHYSVGSDPAERTIAGASYSGLAALWLGLEYPHVFSNVVSQSGAFYWHDDLLIKIIQGMDSVPLNVQLEVGSLEPDVLVSASVRMHDALKGKAHSLEFRHTTGGHHYGYWGETLMVALSRIKDLQR